MTATPVSSLPDCRPLLADPDDLTLVFQPIVDLAAARIAGYQALSRFPGTAGPGVWSAAAADCGLAAELEALAIAKALAVVPLLPDDTFLTVDVSPHLLGSAPVQDALATRPDLSRVVVELTGHTPVDDLDVLRRRTDALRARGAVVALDGAGSGLQQMAAVRPRLVTLDRALVTGVDTDPVRTALAEVVGEFTGRIGARLLAEGVETVAELTALTRLGVPLAQGWLLGRPTPGFAPLAPEVAVLVRAHVARVHVADGVAALVRPVRQSDVGEPPAVPPAVLVGGQGEPVALVLACPRTGKPYLAPVSLQAHPADDVAATLRRAVTRPPAQRFDPVVCTDASGAVVGLLRVEDLAAAVTR
ncbi:EAL domain, c-di-GMP-specific phosphodiesterase class I (or its enzymatically inactive variant) [Geodermatophilus obscurus]|uniref:EAL domain, c-di-GMP-specific phosphodiesterase class I (Or its enzymatically inactive variant) n=1 Tax=Geodermatophilus obscurus TaxID=1861 RepID=A0A1M7UFZ5_9ACTN|nr:EAL domain-containing protein [Geodermatophilus obscurus]SHN81923.1 EAL domain, c-di-GMP-specific phosphodiesterase class I (or its enzymatically inactive variant) [Geodermatophilus obscurus]